MNRYSDSKKVVTKLGKTHLHNTIYPEIPNSENDIYIITTLGDRYDTLASNFYGDSTLWWVIATANNTSKDSLIPSPGTQLRIPTNIQDVIANFKHVNYIR
jgi:hypothetical protein